MKKEWVHNPRGMLLPGKAQDISSFRPGSLVTLLGVGGLLMIECFERWKEKGILAGNHFITIPAYYPLELRFYLKDQGVNLIKDQIIFEKGRAYEALSFDFSKRGTSSLKDCDENLWREAMTSSSASTERYLKDRYRNLRDKRSRSEREDQYLSRLSNFLQTENVILNS